MERDRTMEDLKKYEITGPSMIIDADNEDEARQKYIDLLDEWELDCEVME